MYSQFTIPAVSIEPRAVINLDKLGKKKTLDKSDLPSGTELIKGGPYIGPRGGKWADVKHTIPWKQAKKKKAKKKKKKEESIRHWVSVVDVGLPRKTIDKYKGPEGYTAKRQELHSKIVSKFVDHVPAVPKDQKPVALVMMGGGGAGKGTVVRHVMGDANDFVNVNPDDCKEALPEYQKALDLGKRGGKTISARDAAFMAHEESSDISESVLAGAMDGRKNLILDGTGKEADKYQQKIKNLKDAGYHVRVMMPHIDLDEAKRRADIRAEKTGRYVPHEILEMAHHLIPGNFETIARSADEFALFDNGGRPPKPVWTFDGKEENVLDKSFVSSFKTLGKKRHNIAREKGWMKSLQDWLDLRKAEGMKVSVSMEEMLKRMETKRGEVLDSATMLDDFMPEMAKHLEEEEEKAKDGIEKLADFSKDD